MADCVAYIGHLDVVRHNDIVCFQHYMVELPITVDNSYRQNYPYCLWYI